MNVQYITDEQGKKIAVIVPLAEWEALQAHIEYADDVPPELIAEAEKALAEYEADPSTAQPIEEVMKEFGCTPEE
jgi:hypothetical protein